MSAWLKYDENEKKEITPFTDSYMEFISEAKTERLFTKKALKLAIDSGYEDIEDIINEGRTLKPQDKVYCNVMNKSLILMHIGNDPIADGMNIIGAHLDSPRLDLKQNPLYEDDALAYFDTHYYGGIKKYQWVTIPLAMYGIVVKKDGTEVEIAIGDKDSDPVFVISDLLIHLSGDQIQKKGNEIITGENLNLIVGNIPLSEDEKESVKKNILQLLKNRYDIEEDDFFSAEIEIVPAGKARSAGLDESMILAYGQDDKSCAYTAMMAQLNLDQVERSAVCLLMDKEEVGSNGATGMHSRYFENFVAEILEANGVSGDIYVRRALQNSDMLSADVVAAHDPIYGSVSSPNNMAKLSKGIAFMKYSGARGKAGANDANAEYLASLRSVMDEGNVIWQSTELGAVDAGGGGTIAYILANYGMQVVDAGVPLLNMHAPFEVSSKADIYEAFKAYFAFYQYNV